MFNNRTGNEKKSYSHSNVRFTLDNPLPHCHNELVKRLAVELVEGEDIPRMLRVDQAANTILCIIKLNNF